MEKYKYTDVSKYFEPDYGLNLNRLAIPVNPYEVFKCDVPNLPVPAQVPVRLFLRYDLYKGHAQYQV